MRLDEPGVSGYVDEPVYNRIRFMKLEYKAESLLLIMHI